MSDFKVTGLKFTECSWHLAFTGVFKGKIYFTETDTSKFMYEKDYTKSYSRKITKKGTISFKGYTFDVSALVDVR